MTLIKQFAFPHGHSLMLTERERSLMPLLTRSSGNLDKRQDAAGRMQPREAQHLLTAVSGQAQLSCDAVANWLTLGGRRRRYCCRSQLVANWLCEVVTPAEA